MKVLFLDIDGVLNRRGTKQVILSDFADGVMRKYTGLDTVLVDKLLGWLKLHPDVKVVLSSNWRTTAQFYDAVVFAGIELFGKTDKLQTRGHEIKKWLDANSQVTHFAILDDISYGLAPVGSKLVQTSDKFGLQDKHLKKLDKLLGFTNDT